MAYWFTWLLLCTTTVFSHLVQPLHAANVLAVLPSIWQSHYIFGRRLLQQLVTQQNYSATLISPHAHSDHNVLPNIREIRVEGLQQNWLDMGMSFDIEQIRQKSIMERLTRLIYAGTTNVDLLLSDAQVRKLLRSGERFDLLVVDLFLSEALLGLAVYYQIPTVVISPTGGNTWLNHMLGNPHNSALDPSNFLSFSERMNTWQRLVNTLMSVFEKLTYKFVHIIAQQVIYMKHFEALCQQANIDLPHQSELTQNLSLVLLNSNPVLQYPRAYLPNMHEIAGVHLASPSNAKLPNHLKKFIEAAPRGVVYISLGADLQTVDLAPEKLNAFLDVFTHLQKIHFLLKWESAKFEGNLPKNVMLSSWFPQEAILTHPNVKVFISTCGLLSIIESIHGLTPILAIPVHPEQEVVARRLEAQGVALIVPYDDITFDAFLHGINHLTTNVLYKKNMQHLCDLMDSNYGAPATRAVHYINMTLRTRGATFLKSHATHLNFMRTELLDVLLIIAFGIFVIVAVPFLVTCCILRRSYYREASLSNLKLITSKCARSNSLVSGDSMRRRRSSANSFSSNSSTTASASERLRKKRGNFASHSQSSQQSD